MLLLRASCDDDVMICLEHTHTTNESKCVHKKNKEKERERERRKTLSLNTQKKVKKMFETVLCPHEKCTDRSHKSVVQNDW